VGPICTDARSATTIRARSGEEGLWQPDRQRFRRWLGTEVAARSRGASVALAVEGCTGWRCVVEEISAAGFEPSLAEPADTQAARGKKRRAKTDRTDAELLRELLVAGKLPESWIPPAGVLEWRERVRLYKFPVDQRTLWCQRIHAVLHHHGVAGTGMLMLAWTARRGPSPLWRGRRRSKSGLLYADNSILSPLLRLTLTNTVPAVWLHRRLRPEVGEPSLGGVHETK